MILKFSLIFLVSMVSIDEVTPYILYGFNMYMYYNVAFNYFMFGKHQITFEYQSD